MMYARRIIKNPTSAQLATLISEDDHGQVRGIVDRLTNTVYVSAALQHWHLGIANALGVENWYGFTIFNIPGDEAEYTLDHPAAYAHLKCLHKSRTRVSDTIVEPKA